MDTPPPASPTPKSEKLNRIGNKAKNVMVVIAILIAVMIYFGQKIIMGTRYKVSDKESVNYSEKATEADAKKAPFGSGSERRSDLEALVAYVTASSRGSKMNVSLGHPKEQEAYLLGSKMFVYRGGTHDFSCLTCHGEDGKRIRLQDLPNLTTLDGAQKAYTTWPAYRVSQGELRSFQWRLFDCFRQQRFPELLYGSDASIALTMYLARNANGAAFAAPAIKR